MKKTIYLALVILIGSFLLGPWAWADEKKEEAGAKVPKLLFKTDVGENIIDFKQLEHGEKVAIATATKLFLYDKKGVLRWQKNFDKPLANYFEQTLRGWDAAYITTVDEEEILAHTIDTLYLLDENGKEKWSYKPGLLMENYSFSEDGKFLAIVYIDKDSYYQLELLKLDDDKVKSLWRYKISDQPKNVAGLGYERSQYDVPFTIHIVGEGKRIVLDGAPRMVAFLGEKGTLLKQEIFATHNVVSSYSSKDNLLTLVKETTLNQYDASGNQVLTMQLPDNQAIDSWSLIYYFSTKKIFYLNLFREHHPNYLTYLFDKKGEILVKMEDNLSFSETVPTEDHLIGCNDASNTISKYDVESRLFSWSTQKPRGETTSLLVNKKEEYVVVGRDNVTRYLDSATLLIYDLVNGKLIWQEKLGTTRAIAEHGKSLSKYLTVIVDDKSIYYYDLKPILKKENSNEDK